jgi:acyl transferase domain-containing protein/NAD(P)-dependent dehydrogenase (short-subunit alcohol dehydrogenase family)/acyl carrier protein
MSRHNSEREEVHSTHSSDTRNRAAGEKKCTAEESQDWLISKLSDLLGLDSSEIDVNEAFASFGIDSAQAVGICGDLEIWLGRRLPPTLLYDYPTIQLLSEHLAHPSGSEGSGDEYDESSQTPKEPIAIIGIGCRFPGAGNPTEFWNMLREGRDAITEVPADRWDVDSFYDPNPATVGKINSRWGGFIDNIDKFDAQFFGISPREASRMDPQQRIMLEVVWEALEDAGQVPALLAGSRTGVFIGIGTVDFGRMQISNLKTASNPYAGTGGALSIAANRVSYVFNFRGPSITVDTACSSSLVATHLACQSLWNGESSLALAGGVNIILDPRPGIALSKGGFLSPDGRCRAFDVGANGYVRAEGAGVVVLKSLSKALEDGDPIYGVIRSTAINQDGHSNGLTAPNQQAQELLLREAYRQAGISPGQVQYVETHGTGTSLGDPIEVKALGTVLGIDRPDGRRFAIGSVKSNMGHAETAAGIASLIKVSLMLKHRLIPASLHFREPNPHIPFDTLPVYVQESLGPWPEDQGPAIAGVSGFGFGGTNAHVVLSEAPASPEIELREHGDSDRAQLLALSARSPEALKALASDYLALAEDAKTSIRLEDACYTCGARRGHYDYRLSLVARSWEDVKDRLEAFLKGESRSGMSHRRKAPGRRPRIAFVFSGQGSQSVGMGWQLMEQEPVFRAKVEECDELFRSYSGWSVIEQIYAEESASRIDETEVTQPAIFMVQVGLASLLNSWGVLPDAVVGHSTGELAAAHISGALSLADAVRAVYHRGRLMQLTAGQGRTAALGLSLDDTRELLAGYEGRISIAAHNGPKSTVISGEPEVLDEVLDLLQSRDVFCQKLRVNHAFHSPQMDPLLPELAASLKEIKPVANPIPFFSTVTAGLLEGQDLNAAYWNRNLRETVFFADTIGVMLEEGYEVFLEISPHSVLAGAVSRCISEAGHDGIAIPSLRRGEEERTALLGALGAIYTIGLPVNWDAVCDEESSYVQVPHYPWQKERYWIEANDLTEANREYHLAGTHPLLGRHLQAAQHTGTHFWESVISPQFITYLADHKLQGASLLPATAYVEMALAASAEVLDNTPFALTEIEFKKALFLSEAEAPTVQTILYAGVPGQMQFRVYSRPAGNASRDSWTLHATGKARIENGRENSSPDLMLSPDEIRSRCTEEVSGADYYQALRSRGFDYGPAFQGIERVWCGQGEALGQIKLPQSLESDQEGYQLHPAILDSCTQVLAAAVNLSTGEDADGLYIPISYGEVRVFEPTGPQFWSHARLWEENGDSKTLQGDVRLLDDEGRILAEVLGVRCTRLERAPEQEAERRINDWLYEIQWQPTPRVNQENLDSDISPGLWLILSDQAGVGEHLKDLLEARGDSCVIVSPGEGFEQITAREYRVRPQCAEDFRDLVNAISIFEQHVWRGAVHLWNLDLTLPEEKARFSWEPDITLGSISLLHLVQALAQSDWGMSGRLWVVTKGAQSVGDDMSAVSISQSPAYGLGGVIASEVSNLGCVRVDLDPKGNDDEVQELLSEFLTPEGESQVAFRNLERYVARLVRSSRKVSESDSSHSSGGGKSLELPRSQAFRLEISPPYVFDNLALRPALHRKPGRGEVEIQVLAAGLNFRDVLKAMGLYPGISDQEVRLGDECAGRIVDIGEGVERFAVGDEVIAMTPNAFASFATIDTHFVVHKPAEISFEEAATIPVAYSTAYYALCHVGRLAPGERILIHAAAGGVGLAAISLAQSLGAEIFATAGSQEKREYLKSLGVQHVMDSRSLDWAEEVMRLTNNEGVDIVLNSLAGEAIGAGLATLRAFGRFVEIGKIDIYENSQLGLYPFRNNVAFSAIDMEQVSVNRPDLSQSILRELIDRFERGALKPLPHKVFPVTDSASAFRYMAQRKNTGKIIISFEHLDRAEDDHSNGSVRPDCTYLITGGLGGLGLKIAQDLVSNGARNLALIGRSDPSAEANEALSSMKEAGASVLVGKCDVADEAQLTRFMAGVAANLPPVRGIVHAAGVLDDGILMQLDQDRFLKVLRPKIGGAWNLHALTSGMDLDFFVLFSSAATIFSNPGQGNYVAANTFLDALAHYRSAGGLPALSINWGPWAEVGMASHLDQQKLAARGMGIIAPEEGVRAFEMLIDHPTPQVAVVPINTRSLARLSAGSSLSPLLSLIVDGDLASQPEESAGYINRSTILNADAAERQQLLEEYLRDAGGRVLGLATSKLDVQQPLNRMGIDSLMAVELKNRIEADLAVEIPVLKFLEGASLSQLAAFLRDRLATAAV